MIEQKVKVGPKGQVVIPWKMRKALKLSSGSKVVFKLVGKKLTLEKASFDSVGVFGNIAAKGSSVAKVNSYFYEEDLETRNNQRVKEGYS